MTPEPLSILSVDMGVRNLSVCRIDTVHDQLNVSDWARLDIEERYRPKSWLDTESSFEPNRLAEITWNLVQGLFIQAEGTRRLPDVVLIERQRFRSASSSSILEWTIRVNMLESMLHSALFAMARDQFMSKGTSCQIHSINPKQVISYWKQIVDEEILTPEKTTKKGTKYKESKDAKVQIAKHLIELAPPHLSFATDQSSATRDMFLTKKGKNDDLADSFLQGRAWIEWQRNRLGLGKLLLQKELPDQFFKDPKSLFLR